MGGFHPPQAIHGPQGPQALPGFQGFDGEAFRRDLEGIEGEGMGKRFDPIGQLGRALATMPRDIGGERSMRRGKEILEDLDKLGLLLAGDDRVKMRTWALFLEVFIDLRDELVRVESRLSEILGAMPPIRV